MSQIPTISKSAAIAWAGGSASELAKRLGVTVSAVSQWTEDEIPEGRLWQLRALGCPEVDKPREAA
ncbi:MAG: Cro/CI family transcriptional regulator [Pseudomonadota bacterium]|jgi:transcriptional regulator with XRE-family HTH domain